MNINVCFCFKLCLTGKIYVSDCFKFHSLSFYRCYLARVIPSMQILQEVFRKKIYTVVKCTAADILNHTGAVTSNFYQNIMHARKTSKAVISMDYPVSGTQPINPADISITVILCAHVCTKRQVILTLIHLLV